MTHRWHSQPPWHVEFLPGVWLRSWALRPVRGPSYMSRALGGSFGWRSHLWPVCGLSRCPDRAIASSPQRQWTPSPGPETGGRNRRPRSGPWPPAPGQTVAEGRGRLLAMEALQGRRRSYAETESCYHYYHYYIYYINSMVLYGITNFCQISNSELNLNYFCCVLNTKKLYRNLLIYI